MMEVLQRTALFDEHVAAGGRIVPFAGYELPVQYSGVIAEAKAVRGGVGMFDVSHMARIALTGERVIEFLELITTNDISKLTDGVGQYSLIPNEKGGIIDDIIVYRISSDEFKLVVNASNHVKDLVWMRLQNQFGVLIVDQTDETCMIAVQGPQAVAMLSGLASEPEQLKGAPLFGVSEQSIAGIKCFVARSGYTGEDGFEVICARTDGAKLWRTFIENDVTPCGLGARDVLRVEAGLPLYGHELEDDLSPIAAGLGWVISKTKAFIGSEIINSVRQIGAPTKLIGVKLESKRVAPIDADVVLNGEVVGQVSSGVFSPALDCGIAFAFCAPNIKIGDIVSVDVRGKLEPATVVNKRFLRN